LILRRGPAYTPDLGEEKAKMRAALESLLRAHKLDGTLTTTAPSAAREGCAAPTGRADLDAALGGGFRRGQLSEIAGACSSGRSTLAADALAAATRRGEAAALVDPCDAFDPAAAAARGVALGQLLWVRPARVGADDHAAARALKAFSLILQAGGFGLVILDLADAAPAAIRRFPFTTWMRIARIVEGSDTAAVLIGASHLARSAGGATVALDAPSVRWQGTTSRARVFAGLDPALRVIGGRR